MNTVPRETRKIEGQINQLTRGCLALGFELKEEEIQNFAVYLKEILVWNRRINLVSRQDTDNIALFHFVDSLSLLPVVKVVPGTKMMDIGSGAGFPGLPLKICRQDLNLTLVESRRKRSLFLKHVVETLALKGVTIITKRAEDLNRQALFQDKYDIVVARAVTQLLPLVHLCLPFLNQGGRFVAYKGGAMEEEIQEMLPQVLTLGGRLERTEEITLPISNKKRQLIIIKKVS